MFVNKLNDAVREFKAGTIDFDEYKTRLAAVMEEVAAQPDEVKARAFDTIFKQVSETLTRPEEIYEDNMMYACPDDNHYDWETMVQAIFGENFFDFYNAAYTG